MESTEIFTMALGLSEPWRVVGTEFKEGADKRKELHIQIGFTAGSRFVVDGCEPKTAYDTIEKTWRHLNFFEHRCYIHARVPRIYVGDHSIRMVDVPWARANSGFTLLFEAYQMMLIEKEMPVSNVAETVKETAPRIWRVFSYWVTKALSHVDLSKVKRIGVDETSRKKGHKYVTNFVDLDSRGVIYVTNGKDSTTFTEFADYLEKHGGKRENITQASMDMSAAFESGVRNEFPNANVVFDKFHVIQAANCAMDSIRKDERRDNENLKNQRFAMLYDNDNLPLDKAIDLDWIFDAHPQLGLAYSLKEALHDLYDIKSPQSAAGYLAYWCDRADESGLTAFQQLSKTIKKHWSGIIEHFNSGGVNNGILEGINSKIQLAKRRARGFANVDNFIHMIYFIAGKLHMDYPLDSL